MPDRFVLLIHEPDLPRERVVQVQGLPFRIGSDECAAVRLKTPGIACVRVEAEGDGYRVVDEGAGILRVRGEPADARSIHHGAVFQVGGVAVRFLTGSVESLRRAARAASARRAGADARADAAVIDLCGPLSTASTIEAPSAPQPPPLPAPGDRTGLGGGLPVPPPAPIPASHAEFIARVAELERRLADLLPPFLASARAFKIVR